MTLLDFVEIRKAFHHGTELKALLQGMAIAFAIAGCLWAIFTWPPECSTDPGFKIGEAIHVAGCPR